MTDASSSLSSSPVVIKDPRYQRGKVYEIVVLHEEYKDDLYVGSTISMLSQRLGQHKIESEKEEQIKKLHVLMWSLGMRYFKIVLIEDWPCDNKQELLKREQYHINLRKPTLNMMNAHTTQDERKAQKKIYREENKEAISAQKKIYREENKEAISAHMKVYCEENKEAISARAKDYYEENKTSLLAYRKDYYEENRLAILARAKVYKKENKVVMASKRKTYEAEHREQINAYQRARRAKAKLSYKDQVILAMKEALALRSERQRNEQAGQP
jgi:hypothetical protein